MPPTDNASAPLAPLAFLAGGGEMGERTRAFDWSKTVIGPVEVWPQSLKTTVRIMLDSRYQMALWWGRELTSFYNDAYIPVLGQRHPHALGKPAADIWSEIWDTLGPQTETVMQEGRATWDEERLLIMERNGFLEETYFTYSYSPVPNDGGGVGGLLIVCTEDTERTIGERRLRSLRELAARTTDETKSAEDACQASARTLGRNPNDVPFILLYLLEADGRTAKLAGASGVGADTPISPAVLDVKSDDGPWPLRRVVETGNAVEVHGLPHEFGPLPGGAWPEPSERALVLPLAKPGQAQLAGFVVVGVSPRRPLNDAYRGFFDLLAVQVAAAVASARAYEEERRRAETLAELDRAKTAFFSNVSHEFRTPLTLMLGPVEDLLARSHTDLSPAAAGQLEVVNRNGLRLLRLVNTLLDFSRIEAGRVRALYQPTDLGGFTTDLASVFRAAVERAGLRLTVDCAKLSEPVLVDRDMWEKVVLNLLSNAFKFTFDGEISVLLRQVGRVAELRVQDTGTGIPAEEMPKLFERFHRVQNARGRTHEGSGIGLALVQELVKLHGGAVAAESVVGRGTTFTVTVPLGTAHVPPEMIGDGRPAALTGTGPSPYLEEALRWLPDEAPDAGRHELPTYRESLPSPHRPPDGTDDRPVVLVADDNADMRQYIAHLLDEHFRVVAVPDGEAALAEARKRPPALVLTDVMMPRLDGFGLLRHLRADPVTSRIPIIMLSARAGEESRVEGMDAGADDYLVKPFSARELLARVTAHVQMSRLRWESERAVRDSEARLRLALSAARMVAWEWSPSEDRVVFSDNAAEVFGLSPGARIDTSTEGFALIHPGDVDRHRANVMKAVEECGSYVSQFRMVRRDTGEVIWLEERGHGVESETGGALRLVGVVMDITSRVRAEQELQRERDRLRTTLSSIGDGVITTDTEGNVTNLNSVAEALTGWTVAEAMGKPLSVVFHIVNEQTRQPVESPAARALREGVVVGLANHTVLVAKHGGERPIDDSAAPIRDDVGHVSGCVLVFRDVTERRRAEEELRVSEARYRAIGESIAYGVWVCDASGRNVYASESFLRMVGITQEQCSNFGWGDVLHPDDAAKTIMGWKECVRTGGVWDIEHRFKGVDGRYHHILARGVPVRDADGQVVCWAGINLDIDLLKQAERAVRESEFRYRLVGEAANDAIWDWDLVTNKVTWNEGLRRVYGYTEAQIGPDASWWFENIHPEDRDRIQRGIHAVIDGGIEFWTDEYRYRRADGSYAAVFDRGRVLRDERRPVRMVGSMLDLTERKRLENELRESEAQYRRIVQGNPALICRFRPDGTLTFVNDTYCRTFGKSREELVGKKFTEFVGDEDRAVIDRLMEELAHGKGTHTNEHRVVVAGGEVRWQQWTNIVAVGGGELPEYQAVGIDITDRKKLEDELRRVAAALSDADRRKDEFLATLAHELRNPLAPIRNALEIMKLSREQRPRQEALSLMERQLEQMVRLVDDLMDISRITRGKVELKRAPVRLDRVVNSAVETSRPLLDSMGQRLTVTLPPQPIVVDADSTRLAQVLTNLLTNAAKYSEPNGDVWLTAERQAGDVVVSVRDAGIGIPADKLDTIFDMFSQVDLSLEKAQGGLGIGLTLVRRLTEMHGGTVEARSGGPGKGSEFILRLPAVAEPSAPPAAARIDEPAPRSSLRILIVDDNADGANSLGMMLKMMGNDTRTAYDGQQGVDEAERFRPDVVLFDIGLPKLNGYEACRRIRQQDWGRSIVLIAVTGWGQDEDRRRTHEAGFDYHMVKPVAPVALMKLLAELRTGPK